MPLSADEVQRGLRHLRGSDPVMRNLIRKVGPFTLRRKRDRFESLVVAILSQQISVAAAATIRMRLEEYCAPEGLSPERISRLTREEMRSVGISNQKAGYLLDLAARVSGGELPLERIARMPDAQVIEALVAVKGIGEWTAHMFLIFSLGRPDVFPVGDLGVRTAIQRLYGFDDMPAHEDCHRVAKAWRPYATIASWYCWRSLDL